MPAGGEGLVLSECVFNSLHVFSYKVFSFVQTLTGCEDQAKLFKDEVKEIVLSLIRWNCHWLLEWDDSIVKDYVWTGVADSQTLICLHIILLGHYFSSGSGVIKLWYKMPPARALNKKQEEIGINVKRWLTYFLNMNWILYEGHHGIVVTGIGLESGATEYETPLCLLLLGELGPITIFRRNLHHRVVTVRVEERMIW